MSDNVFLAAAEYLKQKGDPDAEEVSATALRIASLLKSKGWTYYHFRLALIAVHKHDAEAKLAKDVEVDSVVTLAKGTKILVTGLDADDQFICECDGLAFTVDFSALDPEGRMPTL